MHEDHTEQAIIDASVTNVYGYGPEAIRRLGRPLTGARWSPRLSLFQENFAAFRFSHEGRTVFVLVHADYLHQRGNKAHVDRIRSRARKLLGAE